MAKLSVKSGSAALFIPPGNKFTIGTLTGAQVEIVAQYNPKELSRSAQSSWHPYQNSQRQKEEQGTSKQTMEYESTAPRTLSFELLFDGYEQGISIASTVKTLENLTLPVSMQAQDPKDRHPELCIAVWGTQQLRCVVSSVQTKLTMFDATGEPLRASCTVTLTECDHISVGVATTEPGRVAKAQAAGADPFARPIKAFKSTVVVGAPSGWTPPPEKPQSFSKTLGGNTLSASASPSAVNLGADLKNTTLANTLGELADAKAAYDDAKYKAATAVAAVGAAVALEQAAEALSANDMADELQHDMEQQVDDVMDTPPAEVNVDVSVEPDAPTSVPATATGGGEAAASASPGTAASDSAASDGAASDGSDSAASDGAASDGAASDGATGTSGDGNVDAVSGADAGSPASAPEADAVTGADAGAPPDPPKTYTGVDGQTYQQGTPPPPPTKEELDEQFADEDGPKPTTTTPEGTFETGTPSQPADPSEIEGSKPATYTSPDGHTYQQGTPPPPMSHDEVAATVEDAKPIEHRKVKPGSGPHGMSDEEWQKMNDDNE